MTDDTGEPSRRKSRAIWWVYTAFGVIALTVAAMGALAICAAEFKWRGFWPGAGQPFATVVAGMAALAAGGLAFYNGERQRVTEAELREIESQQWREEQAREAQQWREEQRRDTAKDLRTRFIAAAAQLADEKAAMRRLGAYVIAGLADDWHAFGDDIEHQVCIDVLTGYLIEPEGHARSCVGNRCRGSGRRRLLRRKAREGQRVAEVGRHAPVGPPTPSVLFVVENLR